MDSAFFHTEIECPLCKTENKYETLRVGAYLESGRDSDFCPSKVTWRAEEFKGYNPLVFFIVTCPKCYYSREFTDSFKSWKTDSTFKTYRLKPQKEKHLRELNDRRSVIRTLGEAIDLKGAPNESAIVKLLLAIYDESLNERASQLDLGRFYIRIGWVFRSLDDYVTSPGIGGQVESVQTDRAFREWSEAYHSWISAREEFFETIPADRSGEFTEFKEMVLAHEVKCREILSDVARQINNGKDGDNKSPDASGKGGFGDAGGLEEFLRSLKVMWPQVPLNERESLELAVQYYQNALEMGKEVAAGNQQIQVCYLIGELSRRIGLHEQAQSFFNSVLKVGQEFVHRNNHDSSRTALAKKILELTMEQNRLNREEMKKTASRSVA